ncbi:DUF6525 family protein [Pseudooceanicola aestuarii]|uniref:DUF6525 family protein n=1 Tax=Pseudooceanicola aestuarii TaxID=2697319 RepID=UPI001EF8255C|nr:DUF6525 family protein [Pseudooceanicola aestuarii]
MTRANMATTLKRRRRSADPMATYDSLPPPLRRWLAGATLPWSPRSALRLWRRLARDHGPDAEAILSRLTEIEARTLARDRLRPSHPDPAPSGTGLSA